MTVLEQIGPFIGILGIALRPTPSANTATSSVCVLEYRVLPFDSMFEGHKLESDPRKRVSATHLTALLQGGGSTEQPCARTSSAESASESSPKFISWKFWPDEGGSILLLFVFVFLEPLHLSSPQVRARASVSGGVVGGAK